VARPDVFLHIGVPKTGTTFLQQLLAANRASLRTQGMLYPGRRVDHFLPAQDVMGHAFHGHVDPRVPGTWAKTVDQVRRWPGSSVLSHELLSLAGPEQIERIVADFEGRRVRVVVTVRDLVRQIPAMWQEDVKNGLARPFDAFVRRVRNRYDERGSQARGFWGYQAVPEILSRWERVVPVDDVLVVTVPPAGGDRMELVHRFSDALSVQLPVTTVSAVGQNVSLGASQTEFLRRMNAGLAGETDWPRYRQLVKRWLVPTVLVAAPDSVAITLSDEPRAWAAQASREMADALAERGYPVVGELSDLAPEPEVVPEVPGPVVDEAAVAAVGASAVSRMLLLAAEGGDGVRPRPARRGRAERRLHWLRDRVGQAQPRSGREPS
jgi:hypothetical protein